MGWAQGLTRNQWTVLLIAWFGWVFDVMDSALFSFAKVPMLTSMLGEAEYKLHGAAIDGKIQALFLAGWAVGGLLFGILADRIGRTRVLVITILLYCAFTGLTALCTTPEQVACVRFLTALGIGGEWAAGAALVAETVPNKARAAAAALLQSAAAFGPWMAALINIGLRGQPWQYLFIVGIIPAIVCIFVRTRTHEPEHKKGSDKLPIVEVLRQSPWRRHAIIGMIICAVCIAGTQTATYWLPNLVKEVSPNLSKAVVDTRTSVLTLVSHLGTLIGVFLVPAICNRLGRKKTLGFFYLATPIIVVLALGGGTSYTHLLIFFPVIFLFAIGISAAFPLYLPELFPSRLRATGAGLAYNVGRAFTIAIPVITGAISTRAGGSIATAVTLSGTIYFLGIIALPFVPETVNQPLPE